MKITCEKQLLQDALGLALRAVSTRTTNPILESVLISTIGNDGITIKASNLDITIDTAIVLAEVQEEGVIAVDAKLFSEIVRRMPGTLLSISLGSFRVVEVRSGRSKLTIRGLSAEEFPILNEAELKPNSQGITIKSQILRDMIRQTIFSVSTDQNRLILTGELLEVKDNTLRVVAVDMYRISYKSVQIQEMNDLKAIVPAKALSELSRMLTNDEEDVLVEFTDKRIIFKTSTFTLVSSLIEGEFIRYDQIFSEDFATTVEVNREDLLNSFERAVLVATENKMLPIKIEISDDNITMSSQSDKGETYENIPCRIDGNTITISFNPRYFIEALKAIEDNTILLRFNTHLSPCTIKSTDENATFKYLIVPLRS